MNGGCSRAGDLVELAAVVEEAWTDQRGEALPAALLRGLQRLVPCDFNVSYQHHLPRARDTRLTQWVDAAGQAWAHRQGVDNGPFWACWWRSLCSWPQRTGDVRSVIHTGDFYVTERAALNEPLREIYPAIRHLMVLSLPAAPGEVRRILFARGDGPAFTERDRQIAALARPHINEIWLDSERLRRDVPRLTLREREVLRLAAAGLSYAEIAARLFISVGTVRKHMEHIRERLGVHSVTAAAAVVYPNSCMD